MSISSAHTAQHSRRSIIAITLTVIYLMLSLSPLASLAMHSKTVAHAVTGECSGDCNICGCSVESRAADTCCCSRKRTQLAHNDDDDEAGIADCCKKKRPAAKQTVIASCGCPCGNGKIIALSGGTAGDILPFYFTEQFETLPIGTRYSEQSRSLATRLDTPPDPPPRHV